MTVLTGEAASLVVVVVVEDAAGREGVERLLREIPRGVRASFVLRGEALEWCRHRGPDLVVVDFRMPDLGGLALISRLRELPHLCDIPMIVLAQERDRPAAQAACVYGAVDVVSKDVDPAEFGRRTASLLTLRQSQRALLERVNDLRSMLTLERERSARQSRRFEVLWRLACEAGMSDEHRVQEMLEEGARSFGVGFYASLGHIEGANFLIDCVAFRSAEAAVERTVSAIPPGAGVPLEETVVSLLPRNHRARWWDDLEAEAETRDLKSRAEYGWRTAIGALFTVGQRTWSLMFYSQFPDRPRFSATDGAYVELLSSFFALKFQERENEQRLRFQAEHDELTGVVNRAQLRGRLDAAIEAAADGTGFFGVVMLDVDHFKEVNDSFGHFAGDAVLVEVARRLKQVVRGEDVVARFGGDEFAILIADVHNVRDAETLCGRICQSLAQPYAVVGEVVHSSCSVGVALYPEDGKTADILFARADAALFRAKQNGRARFEFFRAEIGADIQRRRVMTEAIHRGLSWDEFELYLQPEIDLRDGRLVGAEALIRWNHPQAGLVPPSEFIPFAEENAMIALLSVWVTKRALAVAAEMCALWPDFKLYFNLSANQLYDPEFTGQITEDMQRLRLAGANLGVEITESVAMRNPRETNAVLKVLRDCGVSVALDDFGTGYSSLAYLKHLPVDVIKIDRTFLNGVPENFDDVAIVDTIISFGHKLGRLVVAEGVETSAQLEWLRERGCDRAQGYHISKPMSVESFVQWARGRLIEPTHSEAAMVRRSVPGPA